MPGMINLFKRLRCFVASSKLCPPDKKAMPGTAGDGSRYTF